MEHIKLFSALNPNDCLSLMENQRKSFLLDFTCNFNEWILKLLGSKKDVKHHKSITKPHHGTYIFQVFVQETEFEVIIVQKRNISASILDLLETSSHSLWTNPSLSHLFSVNWLIQLTNRSDRLIHRAGWSGSAVLTTGRSSVSKDLRYVVCDYMSSEDSE